MITPKIDFGNLVCGLLPWFKRQPVRLSVLRAIVSPLVGLFAEFGIWRSNTRMVIGVTAQVGVLEGYLRKKYAQPVEIKIVTFDDGAIEVGLPIEGDVLVITIGTVAENEPYALFVLSGEIRQQFGDANFVVYIPAAVDVDSLRADIERFRLAGTTFTIVAGYYVTDELGRRFIDDAGNNITIIQKR